MFYQQAMLVTIYESVKITGPKAQLAKYKNYLHSLEPILDK